MPLSDFDRTYRVRQLVKYNSWRLLGCYAYGVISACASLGYLSARLSDHGNLFSAGLISFGIFTVFAIPFFIYHYSWGDDHDLLGEDTNAAE